MREAQRNEINATAVDLKASCSWRCLLAQAGWPASAGRESGSLRARGTAYVWRKPDPTPIVDRLIAPERAKALFPQFPRFVELLPLHSVVAMS